VYIIIKPIICMETQTYILDIDNTMSITPLDEDGNGIYHKAKPVQPVLDKINILYNEGHKVILFTARGMRTFQGDVQKIENHHRPILEVWLEENNVKYHQLIFGKPWGRNVHYIDDRALNIDQFVEFSPSNYEKCLNANKWKTYAKL